MYSCDLDSIQSPADFTPVLWFALGPKLEGVIMVYDHHSDDYQLCHLEETAQSHFLLQLDFRKSFLES